MIMVVLIRLYEWLRSVFGDLIDNIFYITREPMDGWVTLIAIRNDADSRNLIITIFSGKFPRKISYCTADGSMTTEHRWTI